jgi:hemerythrin-like domain-containing protein
MSSTIFPAIPLSSAQVVPLAMLYSCHRSVLRHCAGLRRLALYIAEFGCDREAQVVSHGLLLFFDNEVPRHYADEEDDLFPALIESMAGSDAVCLHDLTRQSARQHQELALKWAALRVPLEEIAAGLSTLSPGSSIESFARQWYDHIGLEESELLPMASRLLTDEELARIHRGMQERRG